MQEIKLSIIKKLVNYFDTTLIKDHTDQFYLFDSDLDGNASSCTTGQVACLYLLDEIYNGNDRKKIIKDLLKQIRNQQLTSGAFAQPYFVEHGKQGTIDIAEIGAVSNALFHIYQQTGIVDAKKVLISASNYLLTQVSKENPGAVYKNPQAKQHDVLNGDIYAAHTWGRAFQLTEDKKYLDQSLTVVEHILSRFGVNSKGWWPYIELWNGQVGMGNSVSYQATIIAFTHTILPFMDDSLRNKWMNVVNEAIKTIEKAVDIGPNDENEEPWWCRDWNNTWEIYLAFYRFENREKIREIADTRLIELNRDFQQYGIDLFKPKIDSKDPNKSPVTTTFRKAATFSGIFSYIVLDEKYTYLN
ncbi:hypothetical protein CIL05_01000 [Virgibacillus profundi]|uniref:Squalene cyclase C-terminal domain-containing protein n=1 Tax=Virgibacillus profundi TaxID=2024555 RepID=A0A2A2IGX6_9BACI|nr:hypothetical protein [Virgibacillus profundi]PAV31261.1 hypothetical protein CIL05_01000 [Virgibacillus profundi]PXY55446.1 hypothetical protein CIT14_01005 [Virgibacillus profundi]